MYGRFQGKRDSLCSVVPILTCNDNTKCLLDRKYLHGFDRTRTKQGLLMCNYELIHKKMLASLESCATKVLKIRKMPI